MGLPLTRKAPNNELISFVEAIMPGIERRLGPDLSEVVYQSLITANGTSESAQKTKPVKVKGLTGDLNRVNIEILNTG